MIKPMHILTHEDLEQIERANELLLRAYWLLDNIAHDDPICELISDFFGDNPDALQRSEQRIRERGES